MRNKVKSIVKAVVPRSFMKLLKEVLVKDICPKIEYIHSYEHIGSDYGGWEIISEVLSRDSLVYSFGLGEDVTFDVGLIGKYGVTVHGFDPTPRSIDWLKKQNLPSTFIVHDYGLAGFDGQTSFYAPENPNYISYTLLGHASHGKDTIQVPMFRLQTIMKMLGHTYVDVLKMDIEGAEYQVLEDLKNTLIRPRQILIEFHHRFQNVGVKKTKKALKTLQEMGYHLFSVSTNGQNYGFILAGDEQNITQVTFTRRKKDSMST